MASLLLRRERRLDFASGDAWPTVAVSGLAGAVCFLLAAVCYPGGGYNPFMKMLSALGRTNVNGVEHPWCHYLFVAGMFLSAVGVARAFAQEARELQGWRRVALLCGAAVNVSGLCGIALVPENVSMALHNVGCWLAALGGGVALIACDRNGADRAWTCTLVSIVLAFASVLALHAGGVLPFAPWVTASQKVLIAAFALWIWFIAWRRRSAGFGLRHKAIAVVLLAIAAFAVATKLEWLKSSEGEKAGRQNLSTSQPFNFPTAKTALTDDERAAFRWLDHITGPLPPDEEKEWWNIGGTQHGIFAKRYHIAFCGYAAAALGMRDAGNGERGTEDGKRLAGRILGNCIERYLKRDVWAYSMSRSYWGRKPWAPDPCFRENVMYAGHLLQLLALYEWFTGDTRYWKEGFDFVWNGNRGQGRGKLETGKRIHYTVERLIDVTVRQMRKGPTGGVTCEPGLLFFPCNNHPHIALRLFSKLGHGDWSADARRWEKWALEHYGNPLFGGGALNLVYHMQSGMFYPRGHSGLDGWSLLWYEPWAAERGTALALWRKAAGKINWNALESGPDARKGKDTCCDPVDSPPSAVATFLAAAARACDDHGTAERLERIADRALLRRAGMLYLDTGREWRIGTTANRIIALAESNGFRFRDLLNDGAAPRK